MSRTLFLNRTDLSSASANPTDRHTSTPPFSSLRSSPLAVATLSRIRALSDPGDTLPTSENLGNVTGTATRYGTVSTTDTDLFKVNLQQRSLLQVRIQNRSAVSIIGVVLDARGRIATNLQGEKLIGRVGSNTGRVFSKAKAPRGGYFIKVFSKQGTRDPYTLVVTVEADCGCS